MAFIRKKEDFTCEHCAAPVQGSGYTNHCPQCLYSKHVDVNPGDRAEACGGRMPPVRIEGIAGKWRIIHRCEKCRVERGVKASPEDSDEAILACAERAAASSKN